MKSQYIEGLKEIYDIYNESIKPLLIEVEIRYQEHPLPIFNEIRAIHDHISRCYLPSISEEDITKEIKKAKRHCNRIILDCYKFLVVYYEDYLKNFDKRYKNVDLSAVNNGQFYIKLADMRRKAVDNVREAKKLEGTDKERSMNLYEKAFLIYDDIEELIEKNYTYINRAKAKYYFRVGTKFLLWLLSVVIGSIITTIISLNFSSIKSFLNNLIDKIF